MSSAESKLIVDGVEVPPQLEELRQELIAEAPEPEEAQQVSISIPIVELLGCQVKVEPHPGTGHKTLIIGPVAFGLPLSDEAALEIAGGLVKEHVHVAPASALVDLQKGNALNREQRRELARHQKTR